MYARYSDSAGKKTSDDGALEAEHYYKQVMLEINEATLRKEVFINYTSQDKELLELLKEKIQEEVKCMQDEVKIMRNKMDECNRNIEENLRFLKGLDKDLSASDQK